MPKHPASNIEPRFSRLTSLLAACQPFWRPAPFMYRRVPWRADHPELADRLLDLSDAEVARLQADPWQGSPLDDWLPVSELAELVRLVPLDAQAVPLPEAWGQHVGGRKWRQIEAFVRHLQVTPQERLLEWCAGKGHLARTLARCHGSEVTALEWQASLCQEGSRLAAGQQASVQLLLQDVLAADADRFLAPHTHAIALHACGDLHLRLLDMAAASGSAVTLAPCCYHRTREADYRPVSQRGRQLCHLHALHLERSDLALAVQETVTAPRGVRRRREQANAWRLGFDELQRDLRGVDTAGTQPGLWPAS